VPGCDGERRVGFVVGTDYDEFGRTFLAAQNRNSTHRGRRSNIEPDFAMKTDTWTGEHATLPVLLEGDLHAMRAQLVERCPPQPRRYDAIGA
jgi:hypothetical protein